MLILNSGRKEHALTVCFISAMLLWDADASVT